tara:strand:+ start:271 stop:927 length:657 start_codon:yes stop_codon:yes gene_type:complete
MIHKSYLNKIVGIVPQFFILILIVSAFTGCNKANNEIYHSGKNWNYVVELSDTTYTFTSLSLETQSGMFSLFQNKIIWKSEYIDNTNGGKVSATSTTGVYEENDRIWLHPPRFGPLKILEAFPFPDVRFPMKINDSWSNSITVIRGFEELNGQKIKSSYTLTDIKGDSIFEIYAKSNLESLGSKFEAYFTFHRKKGFTDFRFVQDSTNIIEIKLIESL